MKILFIGDVVGRPGRRALREYLPALRSEYGPDFVIVNGENVAAGYGVTARTVADLLESGADCITTGNHVWAHKESFDVVEREHRVLRPANFPPGTPGIGAGIYETPRGDKIGVISLLGRIFMNPVDCPFRAADELVRELSEQVETIVVDFHAEATSEKVAMGFYLDGRVSAVIGTHTHVQTADEQILPRGTAYITDCGMTGPTGTVIGVEADIIVRRFLTNLPVRFQVPKDGPSCVSGVVLETIPGTVYANTIRRLHILTDGAEELS